jgi:hypothetical protein
MFVAPFTMTSARKTTFEYSQQLHEGRAVSREFQKFLASK